MTATAQAPAVRVPPHQHRDGILVPYLIGLNGFAKVGKDTAARVLVERCGYTAFSFSDALYKEVAAAFVVTVEFLHQQETKELPTEALALVNCKDSGFYARIVFKMGVDAFAAQSPRDILQWWGTEYRREEDPDYWVKRGRDWYNHKKLQGIRFFVNTSTRFANEAVWIRSERGLVIELTRPEVKAINGHKSDMRLPPELLTGTLANDGTVDELYGKFADFFELYYGPAFRA